MTSEHHLSMMLVKSCPKMMYSELRLETGGARTPLQRSFLVVKQQDGLLRSFSSTQSTISSNRTPFGVISTNTLRCQSHLSSAPLKAPYSAAPHLTRSPPSSENVSPGQCRATTESSDAPQNMWAVIRPGHVREKIAIFASEGRRADESESSGRCFKVCERGGTKCSSGTASTGPPRAAKAKGGWEESGSAKRRRRSGNDQKDQRICLLSPEPASPRSDPTGPASGEQCGGTNVSEEEEHKISVVEMVAFLEQRAGELESDMKPLLSLQRSSTTITLSRTTKEGEGPETVKVLDVKEGEEPDTVRVSEMVAKLESDCLKRTEKDLSRNNSLKRTVGRVLLASGEQSCSPAPVTLPISPFSTIGTSESLTCSKQPFSSSNTRADVTAGPPSAGITEGPSEKPQEVEEESLAPPSENQEPVPGLLFLCLPAEGADSELCPSRQSSYSHLDPLRPPASVCVLSRCNSDPIRKPSRSSGSAAASLGRSASASQDFLKIRQRLQQLLAPQSYLAVLPHHLLVKIFLLLPTQTLAALKCTCNYFKFIIENYGVRPADSLWVSDPRYRDDPCKQCKKRYWAGDVSLCRWHHKPYCQALPYGPGYWMCCRGTRRDSPGCNVGLHDNRWVTFHSVPIYKMNYSHDN